MAGRASDGDGGAGTGVIATALMAWPPPPAVRATPSRSTIAPALPRPLGLAALLAMAMTDWRLNGDETQRRPELKARTGAPCHTHTAIPPGFPTSAAHWKVTPEGRASTHEDEDGHANAVVIVVCAVRAPSRGAVDSGHAVTCNILGASGHASEGSLKSWLLLPPLPAPPVSSIPLVPFPLPRAPLPALLRPLVRLILSLEILPRLSSPATLHPVLPSRPRLRVTVSAKLDAKRSRDTFTATTADVNRKFQRASPQLGATDVCARHLGGSNHMKTPVAPSTFLRPYTHHCVAYSLLVIAVGPSGCNDALVAVDVLAKPVSEQRS